MSCMLISEKQGCHHAMRQLADFMNGILEVGPAIPEPICLLLSQCSSENSSLILTANYLVDVVVQFSAQFICVLIPDHG